MTRYGDLSPFWRFSEVFGDIFLMYCGDKFGDFCQNVGGDFFVLTPGHTDYNFLCLNFFPGLISSVGSNKLRSIDVDFFVADTQAK